jgi:hypothetical protein
VSPVQINQSVGLAVVAAVVVVGVVVAE